MYKSSLPKPLHFLSIKHKSTQTSHLKRKQQLGSSIICKHWSCYPFPSLTSSLVRHIIELDMTEVGTIAVYIFASIDENSGPVMRSCCITTMLSYIQTSNDLSIPFTLQKIPPSSTTQQTTPKKPRDPGTYTTTSLTSKPIHN